MQQEKATQDAIKAYLESILPYSVMMVMVWRSNKETTVSAQVMVETPSDSPNVRNEYGIQAQWRYYNNGQVEVDGKTDTVVAIHFTLDDGEDWQVPDDEASLKVLEDARNVILDRLGEEQFDAPFTDSEPALNILNLLEI